MREIKFRAWVQPNTFIQAPPYMATQGEPDIETLKSFMHHYSGEKHLMQFTGLKDKNVKEIYKGDIVSVHLFVQELGYNMGVTEGEKTYKGVIEFWEYGIALNVGDNENNFYLILAPGMLHEESFEVIGNIHENPELISYNPQTKTVS